ncbi:PTS sugar transporter subunit IIA [Acidilutibacter cellobiosedens]|uniref:Ascorbate-specific PTS system EIIA component n=1 Tax=Acidilutibacter cellobiosedens TaxID=2507161 RepID=A0A410QH30_9FIRM|nr:PTS sugar transporter subunit IIA [Acidilutibacter cellobiosedens]QAT63235.1 PTS sugar transporter subunit IIA [Acidilutibacter cellobiosedens]
MKEVISINNIKVNVNVKDWREAIEAAGNILLQNGNIKKKYIDDMVKAVVSMGPYMVITPGFALAHAKPSSDVLENSVSLITLKNPVKFGSINDPVNVVLCIACVDNISHINVLKAVAEKLMIEEMIAKIALCQSVEEVYSLING